MRRTLFITVGIHCAAIFKAAAVIMKNILGKGGGMLPSTFRALPKDDTILVTRDQIKSLRISECCLSFLQFLKLCKMYINHLHSQFQPRLIENTSFFLEATVN